MQHLNYYTLSLLLPHLQNAYLNQKLESIWSQEKEILILHFPDSPFPYLMISCHPQFPFILPLKNYQKRKSNIAILFQSLHGKTLTRIQLPFQERCLLFDFSSFILLIKLFGVHSNVILFQDFNSNPVELFRKNLKKDYQLTLSSFLFQRELPPLISGSQIRTFLPAIESEWLHLFPNETYRLDEINAILEKHLLSPPYYIYEQTQKPTFSLTCLPSYPLLFQSDSILDCLQTFVFQYLAYKNKFEKIKQIESELSNYKHFLLKSIPKIESQINQLLNQRSPKELADILLAHLHFLKPGMTSVTLPDLYRENQPLTIPLHPHLTPMENVQYYYKKEQQIKSSLIKLEKLYEEYAQKLKNIEKTLIELSEIKTNRDLRQFIKKYKLLLREFSSYRRTEKEIRSLPRLDVDGYQIYYGRSAKENEFLVQRVAKKNDWWFHVKEGTGGHVIVKTPNHGKLPEKIKEIAGGIAAFLSKSRNQSLVLVQYTQKKYLRKGKGLPPGTFLVEREETLLVPPFQVD